MHVEPLRAEVTVTVVITDRDGTMTASFPRTATYIGGPGDLTDQVVEVADDAAAAAVEFVRRLDLKPAVRGHPGEA